MSDASTAFYQLRDSFLLIQGNWLQYKDNQVELLDKNEARSSLTKRGCLEHAFGYGPLGYHTLNATVERVAQALIGNCEESIAEHLNSLQGEKIEGLSPETLEKTIGLPVLLQVINNIETIQQTKLEILKTIRIKFFNHNSILSKCCLRATIILRSLGRTFQKTALAQIVKGAFGGEAFRYHALQATIEHVAARCIWDLTQPIQAYVSQMRNGQVDGLSYEQFETVIKVMRTIHEIQLVKQELIKKAWAHFFVRAHVLSKLCMHAVSLAHRLQQCLRPAPLYLSPQLVKTLRLKSQQKIVDAYLLRLKPYQKPVLLWQGEKSEHLRDLYLITSRYSQQLLLYRDNQRLGQIVFCKDFKDNRSILTVTHYNFKETEAQDFLVLFLHRLSQVAKMSQIKWYEKEIDAPTELPGYSNVKMSEELQPLQTLLEEAEKEGIFTNLISVKMIFAALQSFRVSSV
jgi:hypothetical protein